MCLDFGCVEWAFCARAGIWLSELVTLKCLKHWIKGYFTHNHKQSIVCQSLRTVLYTRSSVFSPARFFYFYSLSSFSHKRHHIPNRSKQIEVDMHDRVCQQVSIYRPSDSTSCWVNGPADSFRGSVGSHGFGIDHWAYSHLQIVLKNWWAILFAT